MKKRNFITAAVSFILVFILVFASGCANANKPSEVPETTTLADNTQAVETTEIYKEETTSAAASEESTTAEAVTEETTVSAAPATVEEIVEYFNESANRIKPEAKKVVKNYEKRIVNEDKLEIPAGLENAAKNLMKTFMKDDTDPIVYESREEITNEFLVPNQSYVSKLKPEWVLDATCTDKGDEYYIYLKLRSQDNPVSGEGVGAVCDVIEAGEVAEKAPFVKKFTTGYYNCEVKATIDKETGRVTHIIYSAPLLLEITVNLFGTHDAAAGLTFVKDYTITY